MVSGIKIMREKMGISQAALADLLGVSQQAVAQWECGKATPKGELLPQLADIFGCTIDALFGREASTA